MLFIIYRYIVHSRKYMFLVEKVILSNLHVPIEVYNHKQNNMELYLRGKH